MDGRRQGIPRTSQSYPNSRQNRGRFGPHTAFGQFNQGRQQSTSNFSNGNNTRYNWYNTAYQSSEINQGNPFSHHERQSSSNSTNRNNQGYNPRYPSPFSHHERQSSSNSTNGNNRGYNPRYPSAETSSRGRNWRNTPNSKQNREKRPIGFKALESLLEKDPEELILELSNSNRGIIELVQGKLTEDFIILLIRILKKVLDSSFDETKYKVLQLYLDDAFVDKLVKYILYLPMQNRDMKKHNQYFWSNPDEFWNNMVAICEFINDSTPTFGRKVLPEILKSLQVCFPSFEDQHQFHISDGIKDNVKRLNEAVQTQVNEYEESQKVNAKNMLKEKTEEEPPDDFRQISVYPSSLELATDAKPFVRKNVVKGPYRDVNHYLDIQFRLLREDFVGPLRAGIMSYQLRNEKEARRQRVENVRIHPKVQFLHPETVNEQYCIRLRFDFSKKKKDFKYENSKRFIFGSLLCFTPDDFRSIIFGKVANRDVADLQKGELIVGFDQNVTVQYNVNYLMVECTVYFEPYYHVLNVLQNMSIESFPMEKYIIQVDPSVQPPEYLRDGCSYAIRGHHFYPLIRWPNANFYGLNDSQQAAFKAALTQEFAIIQGPPGTGKTFLGLKIAKTLLENQNVWYKKTPMLVICYTNHALDQFLEGLTEFTDRILRVGGQSKNEKLQSFNLRNQTKFKVSAAVFQQKTVVRSTLIKIKNISQNLKEIDFYDSIRSFSVFEDVVPNFNASWFGRAKKEEILNWLLGEKEVLLQTYAECPDDSQILAGWRALQIADAYQHDSEDSDTDEDEFNEDDVEVQIDNLFDDLKVMATQCSVPLVTLSEMQKNIVDLDKRVAVLKQIETPTSGQHLEEVKCDLELWELHNRYNLLNAKLVEGKQRSSLEKTPPAFIDLKNPHNMSPVDRWNLYFYWLDLYKQQLRRKLDLLNNEFRDSFKIYEEMRDIENTNTMKSVLVVGMTTTGAARLRSSLQALKSPVVIVEEAAEVLEAHIIAALTKHCQHLILIGDHQQLKPSTANYKIERHFSLGISLFERMVINQIQLFTLTVQHRMRPEISSLITPTIYPKLEDHPSVKDRPQIKGLDHCLYFLDHTNPEADCEGTSKKNYHEVEFLINFAKHLVLNGYKPEQITILAAYLGQMFEMQKQKKKHRHVLENIRIAVLDNYQGEECDIILLSLVRNNQNNKIGFLSIENRVCVALSRARNGFFLMGNMTQLCSQTELWQKIRRTLEQQDAIGTELPLRCQVHTDKVTYVKKGEDFLKIPEGGCDQKCGADLVCGHKCTKCCHILDRDHLGYKCRETCNKRLCNENPLHLCKDMCYEKCRPCYYSVPRSLNCGHTVNLECHIDPDAHNCTVLVSTTLPCGHIADKPCYRDAQTYRCPHPCEVKVEPCGHACAMNCHIRLDPDHLEYKCRKKCAQYRKGCTVKTDAHLCQKACYEECDPCRILVKKERSVCPHLYDVECSANVDDIVCEKPCTKKLPCSHKCKSKCHEPCGKCEIKVEKIAPCGHNVKVKCCEEPNQKLCNRKCPRKLACGHNCTKNCNEPCTTKCNETVKCALMAPCGHQITQIKCWVTNSNTVDSKILLKYCNNPCPDELECGHMCSGSCGECYQGRVHKPCTEKCGFPLVCTHLCKFPCRQACRPCALPCPYRCKHSSCGKRCGDVCTPCKEKCERRCRHQKCTRFCGDFCDVPACTKPCEKLLKCGHPCVGFCGDPCPPKCLICDKEELTTIFFGSEDEEGARFVRLNDCGHILESEGLEEWMKRDDNAITFKVCPMCKTPIKTTQRYSDLIKRALADVAKVKLKFYGESREIQGKRGHLLLKLVVLKHKSDNIFIHLDCPKLAETFKVLQSRLQNDRKGKRQPINKSELNAVDSKLQIIEHIVNICTKVNTTRAEHEVYFPQVEFLLNILNRDENNITNQEIADIQLELNRLSRLVEYGKVMKSPSFNVLRNNKEVKNLVDKIAKIFFGVGKFHNSKEEDVIRLLKELSKLCSSGIGISEKEKREIVAAIGLKQGHWFKCRNGHPYAIGECGGAMQESKCPECGAIIGGGSHSLAADNSLATEMDGARFAAWSDAANMRNYQL